MSEALRGTVAGVVAMVPEGLVLLTSVAFAVGVVRLGRRRVLVRELPAVEGLARVDVLCIDKTGTLTEGHLSVEEVEVFDVRARLRGCARRARGRRSASECDARGDRRAIRRPTLGLGSRAPSSRSHRLASGAAPPSKGREPGCSEPPRCCSTRGPRMCCRSGARWPGTRMRVDASCCSRGPMPRWTAMGCRRIDGCRRSWRSETTPARMRPGRCAISARRESP